MITQAPIPHSAALAHMVKVHSLTARDLLGMGAVTCLHRAHRLIAGAANPKENELATIRFELARRKK